MVFYFAYGSNMSRTVIAQHCPSARPVGPARLEGWRFFISADGYASIAPAPSRTVHGALWRIPPRELAALDAYEDIASGLYHRRPLSVRHRGRRVSAFVYLGRSRSVGRPRPGYQDRIVLPAAHAWGLPKRYLAELARWARASRSGEARA